MEDYYKNGFDFGYGKKASSGHRPGDYPQTEKDKKSYARGIEDGIRHRFYEQEEELNNLERKNRNANIY